MLKQDRKHVKLCEGSREHIAGWSKSILRYGQGKGKGREKKAELENKTRMGGSH